MKKSALNVRFVCADFGAEVGGIDLSETPSPEIRDELRALLEERSLLLFRDQGLSSAQQLEVGNIFGTISKKGHNYATTPDGVRYISNVVQDGLAPHGELTFHMDHSFYQTPTRLIMLYGIEVPPPGCGGQTLFASMRSAYDRLPRALQERIEGMQALHLVDYSPGCELRNPSRYRDSEIPGNQPRAIHEISRTHPQSGAKVLYLSRRHVDYIFGLRKEQSEELLDELFSYLYRPEAVYTHDWRAGDLVIWDNLTLQHARTAFSAEHRRNLCRTQVQ